MAVQDALGGTVAWVSDIEPGPCAILAHHHPDVPNLGDITTADWTAVEPVDVLTGGYPCQPFSHAGQRRGTFDDRHLWPYVVEALSVLRPRFAFFENVQGHLTLGFDQVLRDLNTLGYTATWVLISAASVGAPHRRNRLFILTEDARGQLRSRTDRRRGLHRDSGSGRLVPGPTQGVNVGQGDARTSADAANLRREDRRRSGSDRHAPGVVHVATDRDSSLAGDRDGEALADRESRACGHRARVSGDGGQLAATAEWSSNLDGRDEAAGVGPAGADSGGEPSRSRPGATATAQWNPGCGLPLGGLVGTGAGPLRPGGAHGKDADERADGGGPRLLDPRTGAVDVSLLPSPRTSDTNGPGAHGQGGLDLRTVVTSLQVLGDHGMIRPDFGAYAPAIARWEHVLGRPAPDPTEANYFGRWARRKAARLNSALPVGMRGSIRFIVDGPPHRLSPAFVEWMMGLPAGHVTGVPGITRNQQLRALGNGVVPQQGAAALRQMLARIDQEEAA